MERVHMLLVEDNEIDQMAFSRLVKDEQLPYDYVIATSIDEAKTLLRDQHFDVVLVDFFLGDGTALELIESVSNRPLIFITGSGDIDTAVRAMKAGAYDYLTKDNQGDYLKILGLTVDNTLRRWRA